jgi:hypothetical protein
MIKVLEKYSKGVSWLFASLIFSETFFIPLIGRSEMFHENNMRHSYSDIRWSLKSKAEMKGSKQPNMPLVNKRGTKVFSPTNKFSSGPTQPEMQSFSSVNSSNMVDLFSGDFSYNIPLMDVGGYPINIAYRSGVSMDQEASWVGLGWNINPGTITRNLRGLPDDFNGSDSITKTISVKENKTIGVNGGGSGGVEVVGLPLNLDASAGIFYNNYRGWGVENSLNASINAAVGSKGSLTGGLSFTNNSQEGLTIAPSLCIALDQKETDTRSGFSSSFSTTLPYNSRTGLKGLQLSAGIRQSHTDDKNQYSSGGSFSSVISFAVPTYTPKINIPFTSRQFSFTGKMGFLDKKIVDPHWFISGYVSTQRVDAKDTTLSLPAYGYLHYQEGAKNSSGLMDFNREKELPYREKPSTPHIALPVYTYDAFSITGEGTGGMFRAYRGDIGYVHDPLMRTKDESDRVSVDLGTGDLVHSGVDLNINRAFTQDGPWLQENAMKNTIAFRDSTSLFEPVYFRNPGEKSINSKQFYETLGGDDVVTVNLFQDGNSSSIIQATNYLTRYKNKRAVDKILLTKENAVKPERDKRTQVISYLTAKEASVSGLSKFIENYHLNSFYLNKCLTDEPAEVGTGLPAEYYNNENLSGSPKLRRVDSVVNFIWGRQSPDTSIHADYFSVRWKGRLRAPISGAYIIYADSTDDGVRLWINDSCVISKWFHVNKATSYADTLNLVGGQFYDIRLEHMDLKFDASIQLKWSILGGTKQVISKQYLYGPQQDIIPGGEFDRERRTNSFRKDNHISEIDVLNNDGRRYVYGIPVYNLKQREATFAVNGKDRANKNSGLVGYTDGIDNSTQNKNGKDWYFNREETPAYAHSFLLTAILSPDYVDATGNGISADDLGDAVKFNYTKVCGIANPYGWRAPFATDSVSYNEGLKTDNSDDKGNYVYGEKELWYLHSIESKTMIATFILDSARRLDQPSIDEAGHKTNNGYAKRLKEIRLYSKADFLTKDTFARPIKVVHFEYTYELCKGANHPLNDSGKLTLKRIWFTYNGNNKGKQNPYVFNYNYKNPDYNSKSYDRWGNYKDALENPGSTSTNLIGNAEYPYALQDSLSAAKNAAAWALDSISLPSGGSIKVSYESDDYAYVQNRRAMNLFKLIGLGNSNNYNSSSQKLYDHSSDYLYAFVSVPSPVATAQDVYRKYLSGISKLYFRLFVQMPSDNYGGGYEYVSCYADLDATNAYGVSGSNVIWIKLSGITMKGDGDGNFSPLAKAAIQFLRLNLPSKAYPGSDIGDKLDLDGGIKILASMENNIVNAVTSFDATARTASWACKIDTSRSFVRLNTPNYKKYGGGHRVKQITVYDNWDKMTGGKVSKYGQQYIYTTDKVIDGVSQTISSGVASYEPGIGGDENPFHEPIEYVEKISPLGPVTLGYSEEPLGESFFPSAGVGYSKVRVRTINYRNAKSANGYEESNFYTAYDFPTYTDRSLIDNDTKKRYKPSLANFLRINAKHYLTLSQGFKIELNDMHGKLRSQASYSETDPTNPISYTENVYKVENPNPENKKLSNLVYAIRPDGTIDTSALIGKDVELMVDMREQLSISNGYNINLNADAFSIPSPPFLFVIPSLLNLAQREENQFRSVATVKIINRYGILDSVIHIDKGSKVSTKDVLYDSETGDALLTKTQNEFNDPVYNFSYPSHWAYDGMGMAYRNVGLQLNHITIRSGKITSGLNVADTTLFASGDEIIVAGKIPTTEVSGCNVPYSTFPAYDKIWAIDSSVVNGGAKSIYFIDKNGMPYNAFDVSLKIIRSGRRNINSVVGTTTSLANPIIKDSALNGYRVAFGSDLKVINASSGTFRQLWHVQDQKRKRSTVTCAQIQLEDCNSGGQSCTCTCLRKLFDYLIASKRLFIQYSDNINVSSLVADANSAGYSLSTNDCSLLQTNANKQFYALTFDSVGALYKAQVGNCTVSFTAPNNVRFYKLRSQSCDSLARVTFIDTVAAAPITVSKSFYATKSVNRYEILKDSENLFNYPVPSNDLDTASDQLIAASQGTPPNYHPGDPYPADFIIDGFVKFDSINAIPSSAIIQSANLYLYAYSNGFRRPKYWYAHTPVPGNLFDVSVPFDDWNYNTTFSGFTTGEVYTAYSVGDPFDDVAINVSSILNAWRSNGNYGLSIWNANKRDSLRFTTFFSYRTSNVNKRPRIDVTYNVGSTSTDTVVATLQVESCMSCDTIVDNTCRSIVTDTSFNPYATGALGNWRANKNYTYYARRAESDPNSTTNVRTNGTFNDFAPFWKFEGDRLIQEEDTIRWVWNSQVTMFNLKGFEIENRDPLGRFNSGLYGYNMSMPIAVTQNAHYRETAFDGFEDYDFATQSCDTSCNSDRHFDLSAYKYKLDTLQKHTGKRSLKLNEGEEAAFTVSVASALGDTMLPRLQFTSVSNSCVTNGLSEIRTSRDVLLPSFSPYEGKRMIISAWVKEEQVCNCTAYSNNRIVVTFGGTSSVALLPTGNIIEGWQRYESVFDIPADATLMTVSLEASGSTTVYFDDLRIHPFNANMKSFVYNPVNLRLMAELDENNYATFYEYDDDGTLIRVKKETARGIKTIKETRSALQKQ